MDNKQLECYSARHWPAHETIQYDGWDIRFSSGYTKRANSISILGNSSLPLESKILHCEQLYKTKHLPTIFKLASFQEINELDELLEQMDYVKENESLVLKMELNKSEAVISSPQNIEQSFFPTESWLQFQAEIKNIGIQDQQSLKIILANMKCTTNYFILKEEGKIVASCLGVLEDNIVSVYCLVTAETHRKKGFATQLLLQLFNWAMEQGATFSYLLVEAYNKPAISLYKKLGYTEQYSYWYRVKK